MLLISVCVLVTFGPEFGLSIVTFGGTSISFAMQSTLSFIVQFIPMILAPWLLLQTATASTYWPMRLLVGIVSVQIAVALLVVRVMTPVFSRSSDIVRVLIRLIGFTVVIEAMVMTSQSLGARYLWRRVPKDTTMVYISQSITIILVAGRFLTTGMSSTALTVAVSVVGALV